MDRSYLSFNEYENRPILDVKFHLGRRLMALLLCAIFFFPYIFYNLPVLKLIPKDTSFLSLSDEEIFDYTINKERNNLVLKGNLGEGELKLSPKLSLGKNYQFFITTDNAAISAYNAVLNVICYRGGDGIFYTHIVCQKGHAMLSLYNQKESKGSSFSKYLSSGYEALIYNDENQNKTGFVRFEADGTNPRPDHGVYTRRIKNHEDLYEYLEIDPLFYSVFLTSDKYNPPTWDEESFLGLGMDSDYTEQSDDSETTDSLFTTNPWDFSLCPSIMYFNKYISWGDEDTVLLYEDEVEDFATTESSVKVPSSYNLNLMPKDLVINDNMKTLGGNTPLVLNTLTIHENYPKNTLRIMGEIRVNSIILIGSNGIDESYLIETDKENKVLPLINYFKYEDTGIIIM